MPEHQRHQRPQAHDQQHPAHHARRGQRFDHGRLRGFAALHLQGLAYAFPGLARHGRAQREHAHQQAAIGQAQQQQRAPPRGVGAQRLDEAARQHRAVEQRRLPGDHEAQPHQQRRQHAHQQRQRQPQRRDLGDHEHQRRQAGERQRLLAEHAPGVAHPARATRRFDGFQDQGHGLCGRAAGSAAAGRVFRAAGARAARCGRAARARSGWGPWAPAARRRGAGASPRGG